MLGDARKETPEELAERHERVVAASLLALSSLLDLLVSKQQHDNATGTLWALPLLTERFACVTHRPAGVDLYYAAGIIIALH